MFDDERATRTVRRPTPGGRLPLSLAIIAGVVLFPGTPRAEVIERVLAVVQGVVITQSDATGAVDMGLVTIGPTDDPLGATLAKLIDRRLVLIEVERYAPSEPASDTIDRRVEAVRARFASAEAYTAALNRSGLDEPRLRQLLRDELRIEAYLDQRFPPERRDDLVANWLNGLRRRADVIYLYVPRR